MRLLGEKRVVGCGEVERKIFGRGAGGEEGVGEGGDGRRSGGEGGGEGHDDEEEGGGVSLTSFASGSTSAVTSGSTSTATTGAITPRKLSGRGEEGLSSQQRGVQKAKEREMVRQAARRGVAFGFEVEGEGGVRRKVDCVKGGRVVESSFAKGEWGVRWRG